MSARDVTLRSLAPAIDALLRAARAGAASAVANSDADAASRVERASADAATIIAQARADGAAAAEHASSAAVTAAQREGREAILGAQRRAYEALRQAVHAELGRRIESSDGVAMLARLEALARARIGAKATVQRLDDGRIGVRATDGKRNLDLPVDRFVEHELAGMGDRIAALWQ
jgi:vacuolar-type H+-ATPase subunit E/Vma4